MKDRLQAAPRANGHYAPVVLHNGIAYVSGQLPIAYEKGETLPEGDIKQQVQVALDNLEKVLNSCGLTRSNVLKVTVYITDMAAWPEVNQIYAIFFGEHKPARTIVPVGPLHFGALVEIDAVAAALNQQAEGV